MKISRSTATLAAILAVMFFAGFGCATPGVMVDNSAMNDEASRQLSSRQSSTTPYDHLKSKLEMEAGKTYLGFMKEDVKPALDEFGKEIEAEQKKFPNQYSKWQQDLLAAGDGVAVRINKKNYFFNIGYGDGSSADDVKSGRSYGVGPTNKQSDPSDSAYLSELSDYLKGERKDSKDFVEAIMLALTDNDSSGWENLSEDGQIVATDFMAIYTAEADRHIMVNCKSHPWEIDLAAATFASIYVAETDKMVKDGELTAGEIKDWWAKGTQGSGIGETRRDRQALTKMITTTLASNASAKGAVKTIEKVLGSTGQDVIQSVFEHLAACDGPKKLDSSESKELVAAFVEYMEAVKAEATNVK